MGEVPTDRTAAAVVPRRRGKSKGKNFTYTGPLSVIRLELDVSDDGIRRRVEGQWAAVFRLRRALQFDARNRCQAYWAARCERAANTKAVRSRLGLTRRGIEVAAKTHIEASGWMRDHLTKAVGLHVADEVWETVDRHLFPDASGRRHGAPRGVIVGFHPDSRPGPLAHKCGSGMGDLAACRFVGWSPRCVSAPAVAQLGVNGRRGG